MLRSLREGEKGVARTFELKQIKLKCSLTNSQHKNLVTKVLLLHSRFAIRRGRRMTETLLPRSLICCTILPSGDSKEANENQRNPALAQDLSFALPFPQEPQRPLSLRLHPSPRRPRTQGYFLLCTKSRLKALNLTRGGL